MANSILGPDGTPISPRKLAREPQTARMASLHRELADHPTRGLTPAKLARLYEDAEGGDLTAQARLAEDMQEKDPHLHAEISKRQLATLTVDWNLRAPSGASAADQRATEELEALLREEMDIDQLILDLAGAILPGYAGIELEWEQSEGQWRATPHARSADWFMVAPEDRDTLRLRTTAAGGEALRPWGWIVHHHPAKSGYLTRSGLVRVLGWPFLFRALSTRDFAEFLEIYGLPLRVGRYPRGATDDEKSTLMQAVVSIGHNAAGILPQGMEIEFQEAARGAADPFLAMVRWAEQSISKAILGGTLTSQVDGKGSYAAAQTHDEVRDDIKRADLRLIARTLTRDLVTPLARLNTGLKTVPQFRFDTAENEDMGALAESLPKLVDAGVRIPQSWVHDKLRIPAPADDEPILARPAAMPAAAMRASHRQGCTCDGCRGERRAALAAQPEAADLQDEIGQVDPDGQHDQAQQIIRPMLDAIDEGLTPEEIIARLADQYPETDPTDLTEALARAMFAAELAGRLEAQQEAERDA